MMHAEHFQDEYLGDDAELFSRFVIFAPLCQ
jgi:hypothetical protein